MQFRLISLSTGINENNSRLHILKIFCPINVFVLRITICYIKHTFLIHICLIIYASQSLLFIVLLKFLLIFSHHSEPPLNVLTFTQRFEFLGFLVSLKLLEDGIEHMNTVCFYGPP